MLVFNTGSGWQPGFSYQNLPKPHQIDPNFLNSAFDVGVTGCLRCVKQVIEPMIEAKKGTILLSGATAGLRGGAKFALFAPVKFALRSLGQSMFNEYAKQGVHVAHVVIDGVIDSPMTHSWAEKVQLQ